MTVNSILEVMINILMLTFGVMTLSGLAMATFKRDWLYTSTKVLMGSLALIYVGMLFVVVLGPLFGLADK